MKFSKIKAAVNLNRITLILIVAIGAFLRFYNLNWDQGLNFHPDEINIAVAAQQIKFFSQLHPHFFQYNGFLIYLYKATADILKFITHSNIWTDSISMINLIGRFYSALTASLTIIIIYKLTQSIFQSKNISLLSAFFTSITVGLIQSAHFAVTESILVLFLSLIALSSTNFFKNNNLKNLVSLGIVCGLSLAVKTTAVFFLSFPLTVFIILITKNFSLKQFKKLISQALLFLIITVFFFFLFSPYTFLDFNTFYKGMVSEQAIVSGQILVHWNYQFLNTTPYLFQLKNLIGQMNPILTFLSVFSLIFLSFYTIKGLFINRKKVNLAILPLIVFTWLYLLIIGALFEKFIRYFNPLLPFFSIISAWFLIQIKKRHTVLSKFMIYSIVTFSLIFSLTFMSVYRNTQTRIASALWMQNNLPENSFIISDDEILPTNITENPKTWHVFHWHPILAFSPDNQQKINTLTDNLVKADYIVLTTPRAYKTIIKNKQKFPLTANYYSLLLNEKLGFKKANEFNSYPQILNFKFKDNWMEETFSVFDHPPVFIFEKQESKTQSELKQLITTDSNQLM